MAVTKFESIAESYASDTGGNDRRGTLTFESIAESYASDTVNGPFLGDLAFESIAESYASDTVIFPFLIPCRLRVLPNPMPQTHKALSV